MNLWRDFVEDGDAVVVVVVVVIVHADNDVVAAAGLSSANTPQFHESSSVISFNFFVA